MTNSDQTAPISRRILLIVGMLLIIGAVGAGAIALLRNILPNNSAQTSNSSAVVLPAEIIAALKTPGTIKALAENYQEQLGQTESSITYTSDGRKYAVNVPSKHTVLFVAKNAGQTNDTTLIQEQITSFMTPKGYEKTTNTGRTPADNPLYLTFKSPISACQLTSAQPISAQQDARAYHSFTCADSTAISQEYSTIEMLLTLYKSENEAPKFTMASRSTQSEDNKMLSLVNLSGEGKPLSLLFAAIDNDWEYIGNLSGSDASGTNGKYSVPAEARARINDARYGTFLKRFIQ